MFKCDLCRNFDCSFCNYYRIEDDTQLNTESDYKIQQCDFCMDEITQRERVLISPPIVRKRESKSKEDLEKFCIQTNIGETEGVEREKGLQKTGLSIEVKLERVSVDPGKEDENLEAAAPMNPISDKGGKYNSDLISDSIPRDIPPEKQGPKNELRKFQCPSCPFRAKKRGFLKLHLLSHTKEALFHCPTCDFSTSYGNSLKLHQRTHTGEKPYTCGYCEFRCTSSSGLRRHERRHAGEKLHDEDKNTRIISILPMTSMSKFQCPFCPYLTSSSYNLGHHRRSKHPGEKDPFRCPTCSFSTLYSNSLKLHQMCHTGEKPYGCQYCQYRSADRSNLIQHERRHRRERQYECIDCDFRGVNSTAVVRHHKSHHQEG